MLSHFQVQNSPGPAPAMKRQRASDDNATFDVTVFTKMTVSYPKPQHYIYYLFTYLSIYSVYLSST